MRGSVNGNYGGGDQNDDGDDAGKDDDAFNAERFPLLRCALSVFLVPLSYS